MGKSQFLPCYAVQTSKRTSDSNSIQAEEDHVEASDQGAVPPPKQLTLERQLNKSILIGEGSYIILRIGHKILGYFML